MSMILFIGCYLLTGALAGTLSGLLGIGGGVIVVPSLVFLFSLQHFPADHLMHLAAGTSLAIMVFTTSRSLFSHLRRASDIDFWPIYRKMMPGVIVGALLGAFIAHYLHSNVLRTIFGFVLLLISIKMFFKEREHKQRHLPGKKWMLFAGSLIGTKSGLLGIGGGAVTIPFLSFFNVCMRQAILVSVTTGFTVASIGSVSFAISGLFASGLPQWSVGYVYLPAMLPAVLGSVICAPLGASLSHRLPVNLLRRVFATFLLIVATRIIWMAF